MFKQLVKTKQAAIITGLSESALRQGRMNGVRKNRCPTPPFIRLGKAIRYDLDDLNTFIERHRVTSAAISLHQRKEKV